MATYYVRPDGNDANTGLGSSAAQAWRTVQKALGTTGIGSGDTVYIAPGTYRENITIGGTYTAATYIIGDPTAARFANVPQGLVRLTNYLTTDTASPSGSIISGSGKNYINISYLYFDGSATILSNFAGTNWLIENCAFIGSSLTLSKGIVSSFNTGITVNNTVRRCIFMTGGTGIYADVGGNHTSDWSLGYTIQDCAFVGTSPVTASTPAIGFYRTTGAGLLAGGINIYNCYIQSAVIGINFDCGNPTYPTNVQNCIITNCGTGIAGRSSTVNIQDYNRIIGCTASLSSVATGANTVTVGPVMVDIGMSQLFGLSAKQTWFSALPGSLNIGFGDPTGALTTDLFGQTWFNGGADPDAGALTSIQLTGTSYYQPTERNASVMSMQAGSTSRSIYVYLGVTGLTTSTTGLQAYYTKEDGIPVSIPLVAQTPTGAWVAGGFAEVSAINQPGIYRLDIPDAAISAGYNQTVVTVRGASGTNGAVVTIQDPPERGSQIYMGPYKLISNHMGADNPLEVLKGVQAPVDLQLVDNSGGGVDITGASVTAKIYNASSQLIDTYTCTPTYALDGRCSFNLDTTVTDNSGHYTVTVTRQVGGNIVVFGPLRCLVRAN
jgi:hypothetical protein